MPKVKLGQKEDIHALLSDGERRYLEDPSSIKPNTARVYKHRIKNKIKMLPAEIDSLAKNPELYTMFVNTIVNKLFLSQSIDNNQFNMRMAGPRGFEPPTYSLGGCRAIHTAPRAHFTGEKCCALKFFLAVSLYFLEE